MPSLELLLLGIFFKAEVINVMDDLPVFCTTQKAPDKSFNAVFEWFASIGIGSNVNSVKSSLQYLGLLI